MRRKKKKPARKRFGLHLSLCVLEWASPCVYCACLTQLEQVLPPRDSWHGIRASPLREAVFEGWSEGEEARIRASKQRVKSSPILPYFSWIVPAKVPEAGQSKNLRSWFLPFEAVLAPVSDPQGCGQQFQGMLRFRSCWSKQCAQVTDFESVSSEVFVTKQTQSISANKLWFACIFWTVSEKDYLVCCYALLLKGFKRLACCLVSDFGIMADNSGNPMIEKLDKNNY